MEYITSENGQIQADFAYRLGRIILQYDNLSLPQNLNFSSTLHVSILQNVLSNCVELLNNLEELPKDDELYLIKNITLEKECFLGFKKYMIIENSFQNDITIDSLLRCIRNSLSHPTYIDLHSDTPSTGYTTKPDGSGIINKYIFISSPDVNKRNRPKCFKSKKLFEDYCNDKRFNFQFEIENGIYKILNPRILKIQLNPQELKDITINLCNYLAQPLQKNWDRKGYNINFLFAA
jgi:hypothetical protein